MARDLPDERVLDALERAPTPGRATAADVAALGGVSLDEARAGLMQLSALLATDVNTRMEVDAEQVDDRYHRSERTAERQLLPAYRLRKTGADSQTYTT